MKREIAAGLLLLAMLAGSLLNLRYYDALTEQIRSELASSREAADSGDFEAARRLCRSAGELWLGSKKYTHVFIRHQEVDSTSDAFYELMQLLDEENAEGCGAAYNKLLYHIDSNDGMEHPTLGSVF